MQKREGETAFHALSAQEALDRLGTNLATGLSREEAARRLQQFGPNELQEEPGESVWEKLSEQLTDPMVRLLLGAAVISFFISYFSAGEAEELPVWIEPVVIFLILVANAAIGIYQDFNAERSVKLLQRMQSSSCEVLREGQSATVAAAKLVPGDVVKLRTGDVVSADARVLHTFGAEFGVDESVFTGEACTVLKTPERVTADAALAERTSTVCSGSTVQLGAALVLVVGTGEATELGRIKQLIGQAREEKRDEVSPIKAQLNEFGETLTKLIGAVCVLVWLVSLPKFFDKVHGSALRGALYYFKQAVALGVAAIPEGLPAVITTCLALGTRRMVARKALVRRLSKVETLGCTTVICSDKTGTLTRNEMFVEQLLVLDQNAQLQRCDVEGEGYGFAGRVLARGLTPSPALAALIAQNCLLNCEAAVVNGRATGLPTECALIALGEKLRAESPLDVAGFERLLQLPFTSFRKMMSYVVREKKSGICRLLTKGAPELVLDRAAAFLTAAGERCALSSAHKKSLHDQIDAVARQGLRPLALAVREEADCPGLRSPSAKASLEAELMLVAVVGLDDPLRKEVPGALQRCRSAGIRVLMITGDKAETAVAIAARLGMAAATEQCVLGKDLDRLDEAGLSALLRDVMAGGRSLVFARTNPAHKQRIVRGLKALGQVVAMTGDGVNDAPALKQASIGIAMGVAGTEVAKEASDIILLDDNFDSIVNSIEEGRAIFANMQAFIKYMISSNIGEVVSIFLTSLLGIPEGFNSIQLLWVNLVTDGIPATALCFNPPEPDVMERSPRAPDQAIINRWTLTRFFIIGSYVGLATVGVFLYYYLGYAWAGDGHPLLGFAQLARWTKCTEWPPGTVAGFPRACDYFLGGKQKASTLSLTVLVVIEMLNALNATSENASLLTRGLFANPWLLWSIALSLGLHCLVLYVPFLARLFSVSPLGARDWLLVWAFSLPVIAIEELLKLFGRRAAAARKKLD